MTTRLRSVVVTGAAGFIGSRLVDRLLEEETFSEATIYVCDRSLAGLSANPRLQGIEGDIAESAIRSQIAAAKPGVVFHLAGILGGAAEADYVMSRRVNIDATLSLFESLRDGRQCPRVVFASSIAVFGPPLPSAVDDETTPHPAMTYGAQKMMMEIALQQFSVRGWIDGVAIRLPGIVARPNADARIKSAFLNAVFYAYAAGEDFTLPVSPHGTSWLISVPTCIEAFIHAARLSTQTLTQRRVMTLPALVVTMIDLVAALKRAFPESQSQIRYLPDPSLEAQFTSQPPLRTPLADRLGFRHDGTLDALVARAMTARAAAAKAPASPETR
jgi:D-erythronate 2-dehydrogenase